MWLSLVALFMCCVNKEDILLRSEPQACCIAGLCGEKVWFYVGLGQREMFCVVVVLVHIVSPPTQ